MASIFSRIIAGEIPCYKVAEDDKYFAFLDINPLTKGHTLVVPKQEVDYIFDLDDATLQGMAQTTEKDGKGFNLTDADIAAATTRDTKAGEDRTTKINMRLNANGSARRTHYRDGLWDNSAKDGKYDVTVSDPGTGQKNRKTVTVYSSNYEQKQKQLDEAYENKHWIRKYFQSRESYELSNPRDY